MSDSGSCRYAETEGGHLHCTECHREQPEGQGARWSKTNKSGKVTRYVRCTSCNNFQSRAQTLLKTNAAAKKNRDAMTAQGKKTFKADRKDLFADDLALAMTSAVTEVMF